MMFCKMVYEDQHILIQGSKNPRSDGLEQPILYVGQDEIIKGVVCSVGQP